MYDGLSRLRVRQDYVWMGSEWYPDTNARYLYDGMRVVQECSTANAPAVAYTRGKDLSGSLEGAGGIGGLLARSHGYCGGNWSTHNFYHAAALGNVTYMTSSAQAMVAELHITSLLCSCWIISKIRRCDSAKKRRRLVAVSVVVVTSIILMLSFRDMDFLALLEGMTVFCAETTWRRSDNEKKEELP